jgi:RNA polymerase sigma factor (sigma-70 family)
MNAARLQTVLAHLRRVTGAQPTECVTDQELLKDFCRHGHQRAFAELLRRHGPMVRDVCSRMLTQECDADDAFQATFLLLVQKAHTIRNQASVGSWLYGVATRVAWRARARADKAHRPGHRPTARAVADPAHEAARREYVAILDAEVARLPERYRSPVVLCYLESQTQDEAARQLGWSLATFRRRLERGRQLLRLRLQRRGLTLSAALLSTGLVLNPARAVSALLTQVTCEAAAMMAHKGKLAQTMPANVTALVEGVSRTLTLARAQFVVTWVAVAGLGLAGAGWFAPRMFPTKSADEIVSYPDNRFIAYQQANAGPRKPGPTDMDGDPLPLGAVRRLGSQRFRQGGMVVDLLPLPDGLTCVANTAYGDPAVNVWEMATGKLLRRFPGNHHTKQIAVSRDGQILAVPQGDAVELWDLPSGRERGRCPGGHQEVFGLAISPDGKTLASAGLDKTIRLCDMATGQEKERLPIELERVSMLAFTPDGKTLVAGDGADETFWLMNLDEGRQPLRIRRGGLPHSFALSPDGQTLATGGHVHTVALWDVATGKLLRALPAGQRFVGALAFSPDGRTLAWSESEADNWGADAQIRLWDLSANQEAGSLKGHGFYIESLAFALDGRTLYGGCRDGSIDRWDVATAKELPTPGVNRFAVNRIFLSPDGRTVAARTLDHLRLWEIATGRDLGTLPGYERGSDAVAFSPDWRTLAVGGRDNVVSLWELESRRLIGRLVPGQKPDPTALGDAGPNRRGSEVIGAVAFSPDGKHLAAGGWDSVVRIWDWHVGKELSRFRWPRQMIHGLAFSADGKVLAGLTSPVNSREREVRFQDVAAAKELSWLSGPINAARLRDATEQVTWGFYAVPVLSPDGRFVVRIRPQKSLSVWEIASGKEHLRLKGHRDGATAAAFAPDSRTLASAGWDNTIRIWDLATGEEIGQVTGHRGKVNALAFSADGKLLVSGGDDTTVLVWNVERITRTRRDGLPAHTKGTSP